LQKPKLYYKAAQSRIRSYRTGGVSIIFSYVFPLDCDWYGKLIRLKFWLWVKPVDLVLTLVENERKVN
jgi:hypothetical protein